MTPQEAEEYKPLNEADEMLGTLPHADPINNNDNIPPPNAYVYIDPYGRLAIFPVTGGWLGCLPEHVLGDVAPFCG